MSDEVRLPPLPKPTTEHFQWVGEPPRRAYYRTEGEMQAYARQAVLEERERLAQLASSFATCPCNGAHGRCNENDLPLAIASAIRGQEKG